MIEDSFWAPHDVTVEIQDFIADHERLFRTDDLSPRSRSLFSVQSAFDWPGARTDARDFVPFWTPCDALVAQHQPFDVVVLPEGELREDSITAEDLAQYRTLVLPECTSLTPAAGGRGPRRTSSAVGA